MQVNSFEFEKGIKEEMFESTGLMQPMKQIYFDVPQIFTQSSLGCYFIHALYRQDDTTIFSNEAIQIIV